MYRIRQFIALTGLTALEAVRRPICLLLTTTCVVGTACIPLLALHNMGEDGKLARDGGLAFHFVFGLLIAGYAAATSLSREIKSGTASAVLSKPVGREVFFLSKFTGIALVVLAFSLCAGIATLLSERIAEKFVMTSQQSGYFTDMQTGFLLLLAPTTAFALAAWLNYRFRLAFESTAFLLLILHLVLVFVLCGLFDRRGNFAPFDFRVEWRILPVSLLITMALVLLAAIAISLSTRLSLAPIMAVCWTTLLLGMMSDHLFGRHADTSTVCSLFYRVLPNWQHFWLADALSGGGAVPWSYLRHAGIYGWLYGMAVLALGIVSFRHAEIQ